MTDREAMERAWRLAWKGWGRVGANPMVGAVIVKDGAVIGEGFHSQYGGPHAEVLALLEAGDAAAGADLVVTLEPCAHHGKTPPCAAAIEMAGIARVVYGAADVDPRARGGAEFLKKAGITVEGGLFADDVKSQNGVFFHRHAWTGRPFVALKLAVSVDGRIADASGKSQWITGEEARAWVHWLRAGHDAIGVGVGTVRADDPQLTVRGKLAPVTPPLRVVFDARAELPLDSQLLRSTRDAPVAALVRPDAGAERMEKLRAAGVELVTGMGLATWLGALHSRGVGSLLVEGGGRTAGRLLAAGLVDRIYLLLAPVVLGERAVPAFADLGSVGLEQATRWKTAGRRALGHDTLLVLDRP